jgi:hypothetical protein
MKVHIELDFRDASPDESTVEGELKRVVKMVTDGFTSGELTGEDNDGNGYRGWWSLDTEA